MKEVIVIGTGLGGLSSAALLAINGYHVTLLEQAAQIGGCLQCFERRGARFETGMHIVGSLRNGEILSNYLNLLGIKNKIEFSQLDPHAYHIISLQGHRYCFANGRDAMINQLLQFFPDQKENLEKYWQLVDSIASAAPFYNLNNLEVCDCPNELYQRPLDEVLDHIITNPTLRQILVGDIPLYAAVRGKTAFSSYAFVADFYNRSAFRIVGGSDAIAHSLVEIINQHGGIIFTRRKVVKASCREGRIIQVTDQLGNTYNADIFISDIHPSQLVTIFNDRDLNVRYKNRIQSIPNTNSVFALFIKFKENVEPYLNSNFFSYRHGTPWDLNDYTPSIWPNGYLYMHHCHESHPIFARSGVALANMSVQELYKWFDTVVGRRGEDYKEFKRQKAEQLLDAIQEEFPDIRSHIEEYYTATPLTYRDYTLTPDGAIYGISKDATTGIVGRVSYRTKLKNFFLVGQNINAHGILGVLVGSVKVCNHILGPHIVQNQMLHNNCCPNSSTLIIGGGLGGLLVGALLAKNGQKVTILEKNAILGGGLQTFQRHGVGFPTGMHVFGGFQPGGPLYRICQYLGIFDELHLQYTDGECFDEICGFDELTLRLPQGRENYIAYLSHFFPHEADHIRDYVDAMYSLSEEESLFYLRQPDSVMPSHSEQFLWSADRFIAHYIQDSRLRAILSYLAPLYGGIANETPAYVHSLIHILHIEGSAMFTQGSHRMVNALVGVICRNGGQVIANSPVTHIKVDNHKVQSVIIATGEQFMADNYVSAIDPTLLIGIVSKGAFPASYRKRIEDASYSYSAFKLYIELKPETILFVNHPRYFMNQTTTSDAWNATDVSLEQWPRCFMVVAEPHPMQPNYAHSLTIIAPIPFNWFQPWEKTKSGHRGYDYEAFKQSLSEKLITCLDQTYKVPSDGSSISSKTSTRVSMAINQYYSSSPLTIRDYYGIREGSMFGIHKDCNHIMYTQLSVKSKVRNLYLTGQSINLHGMCGVAITAISTVESILGKNSILSQL